MHLVLYLALDLATLASLNAMETSGDLPIVSKALIAILHAFVAVAWTLPWHGAALLAAAGALILLRSLAGLRWFWFRSAAVAVFVVPAFLLALLLSTGDVAAFAVVLPMHILMGLLVVQPRWPSATPSMDQHRW